MYSRAIPASPPTRARAPLALLMAVLGLPVLAAPARAGVIVVDPQGGSGGLLLTAAIEDASDGDILLLKPGDYYSGHPGSYAVTAKSMTLVADGPVALPGIEIWNVPAGTRVRLQGLFLRPQPHSIHRYALSVLGSQGEVVAEDCRLYGASTVAILPGTTPGPGVIVSNSDSVFLARCEVQGGDAGPGIGSQFTFPGGSGVQLQNSTAALFDCTVTGGRGLDDDVVTPFGSPDGGAGVLLIDGHIVISGGSLKGGDDGDSTLWVGQPGSGLAAGNGANDDEAWLRDVSVLAGQVNGLGTPVPAIDLSPSKLVSLPAAARSLALPAPLREGQAASLAIDGLQGDMVFVLASLQPDLVADALHQAVLAVALPVTTVVVGTITAASGELVLPFTTPQLPPAIPQGLVLSLQAVHFGSDGVTLGAPAGVAWIDAAF